MGGNTGAGMTTGNQGQGGYGTGQTAGGPMGGSGSVPSDTSSGDYGNQGAQFPIVCLRPILGL